ncbi:hypothetical protein, partial [Paraburkholderia sp. SIMBA_027]|uniref:hypothetical protein n=1 Tax=Paraburkholderia sp. SIMBA_027 TaxID=3085770 RepID=UPI0039781EAA
VYLYLRRSVREPNGNIKKVHIFSFGDIKKAEKKMIDWYMNPEKFPEKLNDNGFDLEDLKEWILTLQTKKISTGKDFIY